MNDDSNYSFYILSIQKYDNFFSKLASKNFILTITSFKNN